MVKGFKDKDGKFHPIGQKGVGKATRVRYANDSGLTNLLTQSVKDFGQLSRDKYKAYKADQEEKFQQELVLRRKFRVPLIRAFRLARDQEITKPKELEKFIRQQIPDLPKGKPTNRFVEKVLREFIKEERRFKQKLSGKSEEEKEKLEKAFENALDESEAQFKKIQANIDQKFIQEQKKKQEQFNAKIDKLNKEAKEKDEANKQLKKDLEKLQSRKDEGASDVQIDKAEDKVEKSEEVAKKETKDETQLASDVLAELQKETNKVESPEFTFGFPSEII